MSGLAEARGVPLAQGFLNCSQVIRQASPECLTDLRQDGGIAPAGPLPLGYHTLRTPGQTVRLIVAPNAARRMEGKRAGLGVTLYGVRSARNWGAGDFRDLRDLQRAG